MHGQEADPAGGKERAVLRRILHTLIAQPQTAVYVIDPKAGDTAAPWARPRTDTGPDSVDGETSAR